MEEISAPLVTALACSTAAGKNPWVPLAFVFLLAAPDSVPPLFMDPEVHDAVHAIAPQPVLWTLAIVFAILAVLESLADKIPVVEKWLLPVSTAWRPFAAVAVAAIVGVPTALELGDPEVTAGFSSIHAVKAGAILPMTLSIASVVGGGLFGWLATIGKTGTRLLLSFVPIPSLGFLHSVLDDLVAIGLTLAGLMFADSKLLAIALGIYFVIGLFVGPVLTRLTWIHFRIGIALLKKGWRAMTKRPPAVPSVPKWVLRVMEKKGEATEGVTALPCYAYHVPTVGRFRSGYAVFSESSVYFAVRSFFRSKLVEFPREDLQRIGLASSTTRRILAITGKLDQGPLRNVFLYFFPSVDDDIVPLVLEGASRSKLVEVRPRSESARRGVLGYDARDRDGGRYRSDAGSLRTQAVVTIATAIIGGVLTGGVFIPIGAGYLFSPLRVRAVLGLAFSLYFALCVLGSFGFGWPAAVVYAAILNAVALRDLSRAAVRARIEGIVDKDAFLPPVANRVWVPEPRVLRDADRSKDGDRVPITDGGWRAVVAAMQEESDEGSFDPRALPEPGA
jgi:hypothetical protein